MSKLIVSRRAGESVQIGSEVVVTVVMSRTGQVQLAFQAPRTIRILRTELIRRRVTPQST